MTASIVAVRVRMLKGPTGEFFIAVDEEDRIVETGWTALREALPRTWIHDRRAVPDVTRRIAAALAGDHVDFTDVPLPAASPFFERCRRSVQQVRAGTTITYGELARRAGSPSASRAAGQAMRRNPTPVIVPCHRVVASTGLGGFAGQRAAPGEVCTAGVVKAELLSRERSRLERSQSADSAAARR